MVDVILRMLSAIVLAAGSSRRMGAANKLLLPYKGRTIIAHTVECILAAGIQEVIVVTGHDSEQIQHALTPLPVRLIHNPQHEEGMTGSIQTGIRAATQPATQTAPSESRGYMICLSDMVLITPPEYTLLATSFDTHYKTDPRCIILPEYQGRKGNPVIFSSVHRDAILLHKEKEGCKNIVRTNASHVHPVQMPFDHILRDIDFPADYQALTHNT